MVSALASRPARHSTRTRPGGSTTGIPRWSLLRPLTSGAVAESIWTIHTGVELPRVYVAIHWDIAWVGLDAAQVVTLSACAWTAWRRSRHLVLFATASAALLLLHR